jgi:hypothetical protein
MTTTERDLSVEEGVVVPKIRDEEATNVEELSSFLLVLVLVLVWCGVVWCGVVWCDVVWCDVM